MDILWIKVETSDIIYSLGKKYDVEQPLQRHIDNIVEKKS